MVHHRYIARLWSRGDEGGDAGREPRPIRSKTSVPGLTSAARLAVVDYWLDTLTSGVLGSRVEEHRLFAYGFAVAVVRELVLVNLGHGAMPGDDADQPD